LVLPAVDGIERIVRLRVLHADFRVILVSGYDEHAQLIRAATTEPDAESFASKEDLTLGPARLWKPER
jgi:DNA-binding NarL/FixJ family response regulator